MKFLQYRFDGELKGNTIVSVVLTTAEKTSYLIKIELKEKKGQQEHKNFPIPFEDIQTYKIQASKYIVERSQITFTDKKVITGTQLAFEKKYDIKPREINNLTLFSSEVVHEGSKKLLITFPGFLTVGEKLQYPVTTIKEVVTNKIIFQDRYSVHGTYMLIDDEGHYLDESIIAYIQDFMRKHEIMEKDIVFFGTSKGGSIALRIGSYFRDSQIISVAPQTNIETFYMDRYIFGNYFQNILQPLFKRHNVDSNLVPFLEKINHNRQRAFIFDGEEDYFSNSIDISIYPAIIERRIPSVGHNGVIHQHENEYMLQLKNFLGVGSNYRSFKLGVLNDKYINFDFSYHETKDSNQQIVITKSGKKIYQIFPPYGKEGLEGKYYNVRLPEPDGSQYALLTTLNNDDFTYFTSNERSYTKEETRRDQQIGLQREHIDSVTLYFVEKSASLRPKRLIVTFPGYSYHYKKSQYLISTLNSLETEDSIILAFQDNYFAEGSYMLVDDEGNSLKDAITKKIKIVLSKYQLSESQLFMFGASKGATIALSFLNEFPKSHYIAVVPQIDLDIFREKRPVLNGGLIPFLRRNEIDYNSLLDIEQKIMSANINAEINLFTGVSDFASNNNRFVINYDELPWLKPLTSDVEHNQVSSHTSQIWKNLLKESSVIETSFRFEGEGFKTNEFRVREVENKITETEYKDVTGVIEFTNKNGNVMFSTILPKERGSNGKINVFVNKPIPKYISRLDEFLTNETVSIRMKVYSEHSRIYVGPVKWHSNIFKLL